MHPDEACKLFPDAEDVIKAVKREYRLRNENDTVILDIIDPSNELLAIAQSVLKSCNITQPVIVLEFRKTTDYPEPEDRFDCSITTNGLTFLILENYNQAPLSELEAWIYHECGHIYYKHCGKFDQSLMNIMHHVNFGLMVTGFFHLFSLMKLPDELKIFYAGMWGSILGLSLNKLNNQFFWKFYERYRERKADEFAYTHLLKEKKYTSIVSWLKFFLDAYESGKYFHRYGWGNTHPEDLERLKIGLDILKKHNLSINDLMNGPEVQKLYDEQTRNSLVKKIKQLFQF